MIRENRIAFFVGDTATGWAISLIMHDAVKRLSERKGCPFVWTINVLPIDTYVIFSVSMSDGGAGPFKCSDYFDLKAKINGYLGTVPRRETIK